MTEISQSSPLDDDLPPCSGQVAQHDADLNKDQEEHRRIQDQDGPHSPRQRIQNPEGLKQDQTGVPHTDENQANDLRQAEDFRTDCLDLLQQQQSSPDAHEEAQQSSLDQDQDEDSTRAENHNAPSDRDDTGSPPQDHKSPNEDSKGYERDAALRGDNSQQSSLSQISCHQPDQGYTCSYYVNVLMNSESVGPAQDQTLDLDTVLPDRTTHEAEDQEMLSVQRPRLPAAEGSGGGGGVPALVISQAEESALSEPVPPSSEPQEPEEPAGASTPTGPRLSCSDGGDSSSSDLASLRSDSFSLTSDANVSRRSEEGQEDDTRSVATSSVMSLFHRVQLDPLEKDWLRSCALGNMAAQRLLLAQEPGLATKRTALHWAAKQGRLESVDMMLHAGVDVNVRSGYTGLHLASIHGHQHIVHALINTYNAKTNVRDYHGKMAAHYWSGSTDVFTKADSQPGGKLFRGGRTQRYTLSSFLSSRPHGQFNLEFGAPPPSARHNVLDLQI